MWPSHIQWMYLFGNRGGATSPGISLRIRMIKIFFAARTSSSSWSSGIPKENNLISVRKSYRHKSGIRLRYRTGGNDCSNRRILSEDIRRWWADYQAPGFGHWTMNKSIHPLFQYRVQLYFLPFYIALVNSCNVLRNYPRKELAGFFA